MQIGFIILMFIVGACFGSFLCCAARRAKNKHSKKKPLGHRSVCLHCKYKLKWYDNIPIISWLTLKGKCRKCHHEIGYLEIISEVALAIVFLLLSTTINITTASAIEWSAFSAVLIFTLLLAYLAIYDGAFGELPTSILVASIFVAIIILIIKEIGFLSMHPFSAELVYQPLLSILILGGIYLALYLFSKGKWVGDGDWLLGTAIGIALFDPWLALLVLFTSNFFATLVMYPMTKAKKNKKIHFGPFLVIAFVIIYTFSGFFQSLICF